MTGPLPGELPSYSRVEPTTVFTALAEIVYRGSTPQEIYAAIGIALSRPHGSGKTVGA